MRTVIRSFAFIIVLMLSYSESNAGTYAPFMVNGGGAPAYVGLGDLSLTPAKVAYWGLRCYSAAYSGQVADVYNQRTGTPTRELTIGCDGAGNLSLTPEVRSHIPGLRRIATQQRPHATIGQWYDQTGNGIRRYAPPPPLARRWRLQMDQLLVAQRVISFRPGNYVLSMTGLHTT